MYQIDNASAAPSQPASSAPGTPGFFTDGNPATNIPATIFPAEFANAMMLEICNAITGSGQTLNKAAFNQLLTAIQTAAGNIGVTPPQFDSSTKTATTQFVQRALGNLAGITTISAPGAISATNAGCFVVLSIAGGGTVTLPPAASLARSGAGYWIQSNVNGHIIVPNGTDKIYVQGGMTVPSLTLNNGDSVFLVVGGSNWSAISGSAQLPYASMMSGANWTTPPQFDSTTKLVTSAFVQRALGNYQTHVNNPAANINLTAADMGKSIGVPTSGTAIVLPAAPSMPAGSAVRLYPTGTATLTVSGGGTMTIGSGAGNTVTSLALNGGDVVCVCDGIASWAIGGSNTLAFQGSFSHFLTGNGYQNLPGGLIIQWGTVLAGSVSPYSAVWTYPIAFPNVVFGTFVTSQFGGTVIYSSMNGGANKTSVIAYTSQSSSYMNTFAIGW